MQLSVPVLAALGGIVFLDEPVTLRLVLASAAVLGGIALVVLDKETQATVSAASASAVQRCGRRTRQRACRAR